MQLDERDLFSQAPQSVCVADAALLFKSVQWLFAWVFYA